jgi:uncharacterized repeat protein (TIGR01451 family)
MHHRLLPFCVVILAVAFIAMLSRPGTSAAVPLTEASGSPQHSTTSSVTTITTDTIVIPTYPYAAFLYTATNTTYNIPYQWLHWAQYDGSHPHPVNKAYTRLTLENEWLRVSLLPELGGRVYEMIFKPTGNNELYRNTVIKPSPWGPNEQGWWLAAGGIEWGLPVEEHGYESAIPWRYTVITGADGITVTLRDADALQPDRLRAAISVFLPNDRAVLIVRPRLENDRNVALNFKWWDNAMLAPGPGNSIGKQGSNPSGTDFKFIFPETHVTVHSTGDSSLPHEGWAMPWPIYNNRDLSRVQNWNQWLGFFARPAASQNWVGVIDRAHQEGVVRVFPRSIAQGTKGFAMGWYDPIGSSNWTDDGSYYAELHGGLAPTFWDSASIGAHQAIEWEETWYPFAGPFDLTRADEDFALHVQMTHGVYDNLDVGVFTTQPITDARVALYYRPASGTCGLMFDWFSDPMTPATPFIYSHEVQAPLESVAVIVTSHDQLVESYNLTNDGQPPQTWLYNLPGITTQTTFPIDLSGQDADCIRSFDVQFKDGFDGQWTSWLTATTQMTHWFTGEDGHTYMFRLRARDLAGNQSRYTANPFGNGVISVLVTPAPIFETSVKGVDSPVILWSPISWAFDVWNSGNLPATVTLTDTLPPEVTLLTETLTFNSAPAPELYENGVIHWSGVITAGYNVYVTYKTLPSLALPPGTSLTNTVVIAYDDRVITRTARTTQPYQFFLPVILR